MKLPNLFKPFCFFPPLESTLATSSPTVPSLPPERPLKLPTMLSARAPSPGAPFDGVVTDERGLLRLVVNR